MGVSGSRKSEDQKPQREQAMQQQRGLRACPLLLLLPTGSNFYSVPGSGTFPSFSPSPGQPCNTEKLDNYVP